MTKIQNFIIKLKEDLTYYGQGIVEMESEIISAINKDEAVREFVRKTKFTAFEKDDYINVRGSNPLIKTGKILFWDLGESTLSSAPRTAKNFLWNEIIVSKAKLLNSKKEKVK